LQLLGLWNKLELTARKLAASKLTASKCLLGLALLGPGRKPTVELGKRVSCG